MKLVAALVTVIFVLMFPRETHASALLAVNFEKSFPFGPFTPNEPIRVIATAVNTSADQPIFLCEGFCVGDSFTYSLGIWDSIPVGYDFQWGNGGDTTAGFLNGTIAGELLPGEAKDFMVGEYSPVSQVQPGTYDFLVQLQIFAATADLPMVDSSTFSGSWQVVDPTPVPEPTTYALVLAGLGTMALNSRRSKYQRPSVFTDNAAAGLL